MKDENDKNLETHKNFGKVPQYINKYNQLKEE